MKISQHSPYVNQQLRMASSYIDSQITHFGEGLKVEMDGQSGRPTLLIKDPDGAVVKRIEGAKVANKMSKGIYVVV